MVNRSPVRLCARITGWVVLTTTAAVATDWFGAGLPQLAAAGHGGSVGAYLRFTLEDAVQPLGGRDDSRVGGTDRADSCGRLARPRRNPSDGPSRAVILRVAVWGNDRVADGSEKVITGLGTAAKVVGQGATSLARVAKAAIPARSAPGRASQSRSRPTHPAPAPAHSRSRPDAANR